MKKLKYIMYFLVMLILIVFAFILWHRQKEGVVIESVWRIFARNLAIGQYDDAYHFMSKKYQKENSLESFRNSSWCDASNLWYSVVKGRDICLVYLNYLNPSETKSRIWVTAYVFDTPIFMRIENGFEAAEISLVKENGLWRINDTPTYKIGH